MLNVDTFIICKQIKLPYRILYSALESLHGKDQFWLRKLHFKFNCVDGQMYLL